MFQWFKIICLTGVLPCFFFLPQSAYAGSTGNVLVLNSYHRGYYWTDDIVKGVLNTFNTQSSDAHLFIEYMDTRRYDPNVVFPCLRRLYETKYHGVHFDAIILSDNSALEFLQRYKKELFAGVPVVFCGLNPFNDSMLEGLEPITGLVEFHDSKSAVEVALKLHPQAEEVVIIKNRQWESSQEIEELIGSFKGRTRFTVIDIADLTVEQLFEKIGKLGRKSIVFLADSFNDAVGPYYTVEFVSKIMERCKVPLYVNNFFWIGTNAKGATGGCINQGTHHGQAAAEMAIRILQGESVKNIPIMRKGPSDYMFDYDKLIHFGISLSQLPPGSAVTNEPKTFYYKYKAKVWLVAGIFAALTSVVLVLSVNVIRRQRVEKKLLEYQGQLRSLASELSLAEERERRRIAAELDDKVSQSMVASQVMLEQLRRSEGSAHITGALDDICNILGKTIKSSRLLTFDIGSPILYESGFVAAVAELFTEQLKKHNIETELEDDGQLKPMEDDVRALLFRTVRELLINIVKHASARKVKVSVRRVDAHIRVCVEDDGVGFGSDKAVAIDPQTGGFGLFSVRERLEQLGGRLEIISSAGKGCRVTIAAPLKLEKDSAKN